MPQKTVTVPDIACDHCVATVHRALESLQGVDSHTVDRDAKKITVEWSEAAVTWDRIATHLADVGYPPAEREGQG